ncbi:hypothetical protein Tco_0228651 [Tanacetum coccineum]
MKTKGSCLGIRVSANGDVKFVSRVLPYKLGLKVTNLDLLGVIEDEELFGKLVDDDVVRVCLLLALEVIFMGKKLVDEVPDTLMRLVENLEKLSASRKRGKLDTRDLPIIRRCDTTSVEEIRVKDCVISQLNSRVYKLETIIKVLGHERKGVLLDKSFVADFFLNISSEYLDALNEEFHELYQTPFIDNRPAKNGLDYDDDLVKKRRHDLMNSDHWKVSSSKITNRKRSQRFGAFSAYYWGDTFVNVEKDRTLNALNDQDTTQFLKDVTPWVKDLSRYNKAPGRVHLTDTFDIFLGRQGPLRARFAWCKDHVELWENYMWHVRPQDADWAMVGGYFVQLLLQDTILLWYIDGSRWKRLQILPSAALRIKHAGQAVIGEGRLLCGWLLGVDGYSVTSYRMVVSVNTPYSSKLVGFNNDEEPIIEVNETELPMDTISSVKTRTRRVAKCGCGWICVSSLLGNLKESLILVNHSDVLFNCAFLTWFN